MEISTPHIVLQTRQLDIGYKKGKHRQPVRQGLNLKVRSSELLCLMGLNGAGKSTLLRTLAGVQEPLSGEVLIDSSPLHTLSPSARAQRLSLVLTEAVSAGNMTVLELVALGRYPHTGWGGRLNEKDKTLVIQAMDDLEIRELSERRLYELSDGQRQKALIARALAQDGQLIILDEPTSHLDLINRLHIMRLLRTLALRRNKAILVATHELDLALQSADRLWLLGQEEEFAEGIPEDLVLRGDLARTFSRSGYHFDPESGQFIEETDHCLPVQLKGEGTPAYWTQKALQRNGYKAVQESAPLLIEVYELNQKKSWRLSTPYGNTVFHSVEALLEGLRSLSDKSGNL